MIRPARPGDESTILAFVHALARYEKLERQLDTDPERLREHLFGDPPACAALIAEADGEPVGFALYFPKYSTFQTAPTLHLEDLFVLPEHRGGGHGEALLRAVAREARRRGCRHLDWVVLDWNVRAIGFYRRLGARVLVDWRFCRVTGEALDSLAGPG